MFHSDSSASTRYLYKSGISMGGDPSPDIGHDDLAPKGGNARRGQEGQIRFVRVASGDVRSRRVRRGSIVALDSRRPRLRGSDRRLAGGALLLPVHAEEVL